MVKRKAEKYLKLGYYLQVHQVFYNGQNCYMVFGGLKRSELNLEKLYFKSSGKTLLANITNDHELHDFFVDFYTERLHNITTSTRTSPQELFCYLYQFLPKLRNIIDEWKWGQYNKRLSS
jgi:hypothetical protein